MTKTRGGPVAGDRIKSFIERVEKLLEERQAIQSDIRDVFSEANGVGYDVKTMRKLIQIRAMDAADRDEANALLDTYAHAIGAEEIVGTFARSLSEEELIDRASKIVREVDLCLLLPRDPLPTIRAIMDAIKCSSGKAHKVRHLVEERLEAMERFSRSNVASVKSENENPPKDEQPAAAIADGEAAEVAIAAPAASGSPEEARQEEEGAALGRNPPSDEAPCMAEGPLQQPLPQPKETTPISPKAPDASSTVTVRATDFTNSTGGNDVTAPVDSPKKNALTDNESPAVGETAHMAGGSHDERRLNPEPEVARVVPPVTEPVDWDSIIASQPTQLRGRAAQASQSEAKRTQ